MTGPGRVHVGVRAAVTNRHRRLASLVAVAAVLVALVVIGALSSPAGVTASEYGYSLSLATNATLDDLVLVVPLPTDPGGEAPLASAVERGGLSLPDGWRADVVAGAAGPALRLAADRVVAERRPDGRTYSTYAASASVPADHVVATGAPVGREATLARPGETRAVPCPNVAVPDGDACYAFEPTVTVRYGAPPGAAVDVYLVATGSNARVLGGREQYYERVVLFLEGPQDGPVEAEGFGSTSG